MLTNIIKGQHKYILIFLNNILFNLLLYFNILNNILLINNYIINK